MTKAKRKKLLRLLKNNELMSISKMSRELGIYFEFLNGYLQYLKDVGIIDYVQIGKAKVPVMVYERKVFKKTS